MIQLCTARHWLPHTHMGMHAHMPTRAHTHTHTHAHTHTLVHILYTHTDIRTYVPPLCCMLSGSRYNANIQWQTWTRTHTHTHTHMHTHCKYSELQLIDNDTEVILFA